MLVHLIGANYAGRKGRSCRPVCHANAANVCPTLMSHKSWAEWKHGEKNGILTETE